MANGSRKPVKQFSKRKFVCFIAAVLFLVTLTWFSSYQFPWQQRSYDLRGSQCRVVEIIDARTFRIHLDHGNQEFIFALAGIRLLDRQKEAIEFVQKLVEPNNTSVRFDRQRFDDQNRVLGYMVIQDTDSESQFLNCLLVSNGFADPAPIEGNSIKIQRLIRQASKTKPSETHTAENSAHGHVPR